MRDDWGDGVEHAPARAVSDDDRQRVVSCLRDAAGQGLIALDELETRIGAAYAARTHGELAPITADIPEPASVQSSAASVRQKRPLVFEDHEFVGHFRVYCLVIGMLIGIWLLGGAGHFWPFYPAAGWGIGLGSHYHRAVTHQRKRLARARSMGISLADLELREDDEAKAERERRRARRARHGGGRGSDRSPPAPDDQTMAPGARERRYVVAMFVDVAGSTGLNEVIGDDAWIRVRDRLHSLLEDCFARERGWVANTAGDGTLARFDQPEQAVRAAVEIQRRLAQERDDSGFAPSVRIGVHSGDVVEDGNDLIGSVVNLASRVTDAGQPGEITITEHVADHLSSSFDTEDRGIHSLKGVTRPRHLLTVRWH